MKEIPNAGKLSNLFPFSSPGKQKIAFTEDLNEVGVEIKLLIAPIYIVSKNIANSSSTESFILLGIVHNAYI